MAKIAAIIASAGQGKRMGTNTKKQYLNLNGEPVLVHSIKAYCLHPLVDEMILVTNESDLEYCDELKNSFKLSKVKAIVPGGKERQDSVKAGLEMVSKNIEIVVVHDGARPLVNSEVITAAISSAQVFGSGVVAVPVKDTIKKVSSDSTVIDTPDRKLLWAVQTPQAFQRSLLVEAYRRAYEMGFQGTDDASLVENLGEKVKIVPGSYSNLKITTPEDLIIAEALLQAGLVRL